MHSDVGKNFLVILVIQECECWYSLFISLYVAYPAIVCRLWLIKIFIWKILGLSEVIG